MPRIARVLFAALVASLLAACSGTYLLDNQVQSFSSLTALPSPASYRFERLPSQAADPGQATLEQLADAALHKAGLRRDDAAPRYSVQVGARIHRVLSPYADPWDHFGWGFGWGGRHWGWGVGGGFPRMESPWFDRQVSVIVRELATNKVVYESQAQNTGPWLDNRSVLPAMFDAAMNGFPNPPGGPRRVDVLLGGKG